MNAYLPHDVVTMDGRPQSLPERWSSVLQSPGFARRAWPDGGLAPDNGGRDRRGAPLRRGTAGLRMLAIIGALLFGMKRWSRPKPRPTAAHDWGRGAGSPSRRDAGHEAALFARLGGNPLPGAARLAASGVLRLLAGAALVGAAWLMETHTDWRIPATALLLIGLSLIVHFGTFNILAALWRLAG